VPYKFLLLEIFVLLDFEFPLFNLCHRLLNGIWSVGYFSKTDAVRHFEPYRLVNRLLYILVVAESLPLCVDRMHRAAWEDTSLDKLAPVYRVLGSFLRIFGDDIIDFDNFPQSKLCAAKRDSQPAFHDLLSDYVLTPVKDLVGCYGINDPLVAYHEAFAKLVHHVP